MAAVGVTVTVAVTGEPLALVAVKDGILPVPEAARPIEAAELVQLYNVPGIEPVKLIAVVALFAQITWLLTAFTVARGETLMVAVPEAIFEQAEALASFTESKVYTVLPAVVVEALTVAVLPDDITVCGEPLLTV
jgi:hypothetical protein